ncbi:sodium:calcium antiporter [Ilumatobacter sp.]|uniref:sodium:calcium antiporter n=1 Tax=Ilumatobacter sp. TaxID=1967498 RepID=UPI003B528649
MLDSLPIAVAVLVGGALVLLTAGVKFTKVVDELADRTDVGEALAGAVLLGAATSMPGLITTVTGALEGDAGFAMSNALGGIAAQTTFLVLADTIYRSSNLEHAAASLPNIVSAALLTAMVGAVLVAATGPELDVLGVHPATPVLVIIYLFGLRLVRSANAAPMWSPEETEDTVEDEPDPEASGAPLWHLWSWFGGLAAVVAVVGFAVGRSGLTLAAETGLTGSVVGALFTSVVTSLPELVTVLTAVRIGALTLAVSNIVGGNTFDVLFVAAADLAFRDGSVYHAAGAQALFVSALTVVLTALLIAGLLTRERRGIGFEGVAILGTYAVGMAALVAL